MIRRLGFVLALVVLAGACADTQRYEPLPIPEGIEDLPPTSSTIAPDLDEIALPVVEGVTTTEPAVIEPGPVTIQGRVDGPNGPVADARVRLERLTGGGSAVKIVPTAADGTWNAPNVLGGRYRIRAWQAPALGMLRAQVVFVEAPRASGVVLRVERFDGTRIDAAIAPSPPTVGEEANLRVRVSTRQVDAEGIIRYLPNVGISVTLSGSGAWSVQTANPTFTDAGGAATFRVVCGAAGPQPLSAVLDDGESRALELPGCA